MNASLIEPPAPTGGADAYLSRVILPAVASRYGLGLDELLDSLNDDPAVQWPRCVAAWLADNLTGADIRTIPAYLLFSSDGWAGKLDIVDRVMETWPEIREALHEFYRELDLPGTDLLGRINELDCASRRAA